MAASNAPKVFHGARAKVSVKGQVVGVFNNFSYGVQYDVSPVYILGAFHAVESVYTAMEPVSCSASGWRVIGAGPYAASSFPQLQQLLGHEYIEIAVFDRAAGPNDPPIASIHQVRPSSFNITVAARSLTEMTVSFTGLMFDDETKSKNAESAGYADLP